VDVLPDDHNVNSGVWRLLPLQYSWSNIHCHLCYDIVGEGLNNSENLVETRLILVFVCHETGGKNTVLSS
jgi:hypothetical protein